jgi:hypothetical protein
MVFQANGPYKLARVVIFISDKVDFRIKSVRRDNEVHFTLIKGIIHQEEIPILNIYVYHTQGHPSTLKISNGPKSTDRLTQ